MKKFLLVVLGLVFVVSMASAADLKGKVGLGFNWPGLQLRYGITDSILVEARVQMASNNVVVGGRGYYLLKEIPGNMAIIPYVGGEVDGILNQYLTSGYMAGGFVGADLMVKKNLVLGGDIGVSGVWLGSTIGTYADWGLIFNVGVTYYF